MTSTTRDMTRAEALFGDLLQESYPTERGEYVLLDHMTDEDLTFNVNRLREAGKILALHADALEVWRLDRKFRQT
jgi:hypothetical protein